MQGSQTGFDYPIGEIISRQQLRPIKSDWHASPQPLVVQRKRDESKSETHSLNQRLELEFIAKMEEQKKVEKKFVRKMNRKFKSPSIWQTQKPKLKPKFDS